MKKMFYILAISVVIFSGCNFSSENGKNGKKENSSGELIVNNQSSVDIKEIKFCSQQFYYTGEGSDYTGSILPIGKKTSVSLTDEETGYVFFTLLLGIDSNNRDIILTVRTNDIVTVEKGKRIVVTITDNTLVMILSGREPITVLDIITPAILKIENKSSRDLVGVKYKERMLYDVGVGESKTGQFFGVLSGYSDYVHFWLCGYNLKVEEKVEIKKGNTTTLIITDDTPIIRNGKAKQIKLSELKPQSLEVVNNTSYDLYDVRFYDSYTSDTYILNNKNILEKGNAWYAGFDIKGDYEGASLIFRVKIPNSEKEFKLYNHPYIARNKNREILLVDDTEVFYRGGGGHGKLKDGLK